MNEPRWIEIGCNQFAYRREHEHLLRVTNYFGHKVKTYVLFDCYYIEGAG